VKRWKELGLLLGYCAVPLFGIGFISGACITIDARTNGQNGCVYRSISSLANPGYVLACELFRKRFEYESIGKVF